MIIKEYLVMPMEDWKILVPIQSEILSVIQYGAGYCAVILEPEEQNTKEERIIKGVTGNGRIPKEEMYRTKYICSVNARNYSYNPYNQYYYGNAQNALYGQSLIGSGIGSSFNQSAQQQAVQNASAVYQQNQQALYGAAAQQAYQQAQNNSPNYINSTDSIVHFFEVIPEKKMYYQQLENIINGD